MQESFIVVHPSLTNLAVEILNVPMRDVNRSTINSAKSSVVLANGCGFGCGKKNLESFLLHKTAIILRKRRGSRRLKEEGSPYFHS
jgi:hypothetical protein